MLHIHLGLLIITFQPPVSARPSQLFSLRQAVFPVQSTPRARRVELTDPRRVQRARIPAILLQHEPARRGPRFLIERNR
eukprot:1564425-Rhodomonas_salina.3